MEVQLKVYAVSILGRVSGLPGWFLSSKTSSQTDTFVSEADVTDSIACIRYYAGLADKIHGQTVSSFGKEKFVYTLHQPIGVCGQIIPWNYP